MADLDLSSLQPGDAVVALRSFPRRFREAADAVAVDLDDEADEYRIDEMASRLGPDGYSAIDVVHAIIDELGDVLAVIEPALIFKRVEVPDSLVGPRPPVSHRTRGDNLDEAVARLARVTERLAVEVDRADPERWEVELATASGQSTTALVVLQHAIAHCVLALRELPRILRAVRGHPSKA